MTNNQINLYNARENQRHNLEMERLTGESQAETHRANVSKEYTANMNLAESVRHNQASEYNAFASLQETVRHNTQAESLEREKIAETARHNQVLEAQGWENFASLANLQSSQAAKNYADLETNQYNAETNRINATTNQQNSETQKSELKVHEGWLDLSEYESLTKIPNVQADTENKKAQAAKTREETRYLGRKQYNEDVRTDNDSIRAWSSALGGFFNLAKLVGNAGG